MGKLGSKPSPPSQPKNSCDHCWDIGMVRCDHNGENCEAVPCTGCGIVFEIKDGDE